MKKIPQTEIERQVRFMDWVKARSDSLADAVRRPRAYVRTFGCQQNEADSERYAGMLDAMGFLTADGPEDADLILVNTCAVREHAELRALSATGQFKKLKEKNPELVIAVCGCMVTQLYRADQMKHSYPYVDFVLGTDMLHRFPEFLADHYQNGRRRLTVGEPEPVIAEGLPVRRASKTKAWVSIMYGCNNFCTYCVVPYVRGRERSRAMEDIIAEVTALAADGVKEITLLGQNVNSWGKDLEGGLTFPDLLEKLAAIDGDFILRFMTSHPKDATKRLIDVMADNKKIARQFHLPLQSGSARVLGAMNRRYTPDSYLALVDYMRERMPDITITSDIIVGFPGETDAEFEETLTMLTRVRFDMIFSFQYSPRPGTPAAKMDGQIPDEIKSERFSRLVGLQNTLSNEKNQECVGKIFRVLVEGVSKQSEAHLAGRTDGGKLVHFARNADTDPSVGRFVNMKIRRADTFALYGEPV